MEQLNIKTLSVEQLKAMAYDTLAIIEQNQRNLQLLNQEIAKKSGKQEEVKPNVEPEKTK